MRLAKQNSFIGFRSDFGTKSAVEYAARLRRMPISEYAREAVLVKLQADGVRIQNKTRQENASALASYSGAEVIRCHAAATLIGMTAEGLRRLLIRSGLGEKDHQGKWCVTAANLKAIKESRDVVFGKEAA